MFTHAAWTISIDIFSFQFKRWIDEPFFVLLRTLDGKSLKKNHVIKRSVRFIYKWSSRFQPWNLSTLPALSFMDLRAYIKDAVAFCKKHGLVKSLGMRASMHIYMILFEQNAFRKTLFPIRHIHIKIMQACMHIFKKIQNVNMQAYTHGLGGCQFESVMQGMTSTAQRCTAISWNILTRSLSRRAVSNLRKLLLPKRLENACIYL